MKTSTPKPSAPHWFIVDANGKHLGRLATQIAHILRGKHKPEWTAHQIHADHVVVTNAKDIVLTGTKAEKKNYYRHSGWLGHLKKTPVSTVLEQNPATVIERAVKGMLPRNRLRPQMLRHLHVYNESEHGHDAQKPQELGVVFGSSAKKSDE